MKKPKYHIERELDRKHFKFASYDLFTRKEVNQVVKTCLNDYLTIKFTITKLTSQKDRIIETKNRIK